MMHFLSYRHYEAFSVHVIHGNALQETTSKEPPADPKSWVIISLGETEAWWDNTVNKKSVTGSPARAQLNC